MRLVDIVTLSSLFVLAGGSSLAAAETSGAKTSASSREAAATRPDALSADMEAALRKAGFTDLRIMPNSILVRAKDKTGQPVAMVLNPGTMTEMVTLDPHSGSAAGGDGAPLTGSGTFTTVLPTERLASTLIGLVVHDASGADLAKVKDIAIDHDGVQAYILAFGGVLGVGDRYVAVTPSALTIAYDPGAKSYAATMTATAAQLKAAPASAYDGAFKAGRN